ncbi:MAG: glycoside hydrolase family 130 protein [candidate division KSB1 bacterium]|nr:glycoside hydrolase family 130 protein [candidate division KSB1 bacterium]
MPNFVPVSRKPIDFRADITRVILKPFVPSSEERIRKIIDRVLSLSEDTVEQWLDRVIGEFAHRHNHFQKVLQENYQRVAHYIPKGKKLSDKRKTLIGAYFTHEYSVEAAALFNPSIVPHPNQRDLPAGHERFILSLRATGEGHISSIEFRSGVLDAQNEVSMETPTPFLLPGEVQPLRTPALDFLRAALEASSLPKGILKQVLQANGKPASVDSVRKALQHQTRVHPELRALLPDMLEQLDRAERESFALTYANDVPVSERIIFPVSSEERNGIEDARFVQFTDDNGDVVYYAPYTAYDGKQINMKLLQTKDFLHFEVYPLFGQAIRNKGMALFPEKINGKYAAISRQDGESLFLMYSDSLFRWEEAEVIRIPELPWEVVQIGNCGSPIKTEEGWLLLTHGVGPLRKYVIGVYLLDLHDPSKIIGALDEPILSPNEKEREGYVPNVVYSCGGMVRQNELILPYAYSDVGTGIATIPLPQLLRALQA